jgi:hypothetical protein
LTFSGVKDLCDRGKISTMYGTIWNYIYGSKKADGTVVIALGAWKEMTMWKTSAEKHASQRLLNEGLEEFLFHVAMRDACSKSGLFRSEQLLKSCARKIVSQSLRMRTRARAHARTLLSDWSRRSCARVRRCRVLSARRSRRALASRTRSHSTSGARPLSRARSACTASNSRRPRHGSSRRAARRSRRRPSRTSAEYADALLINGSTAAKAAKDAVLVLWKVQPKSATGAGKADVDDEPEAASLTKKRRWTQPGFVASRSDFLDGLRAAEIAKEHAATLKLYAGDAEYERETKAFTEWEALKTQFSYLISRVHEGAELMASMLARIITLPQLKMCVEGVTRARATQANKPTQAALFLATALTASSCRPPSRSATTRASPSARSARLRLRLRRRCPRVQRRPTPRPPRTQRRPTQRPARRRCRHCETPSTPGAYSRE